MQIVRWIASLVFIIAVIASTAVAQEPETSTHFRLPAGDWSATYDLTSGLGLTGSPAHVIGNHGDARQGLLVSVTQLANRSDTTIDSLRFGWFIYRVNAPQHVLASGRSALVAVNAFKPGAVIRMNFPAARFAEAMEPYARDGKLSGAYNIEVAVIEARYANGSIWKQDLTGLGLPDARPN